jgi:hypothetical protein
MTSTADYIYTKNGMHIECYGKVEENSNFEVVCDDEYGDGIVADYEGPLTWHSVCRYLVKNYRSDIVQLVAC